MQKFRNILEIYTNYSFLKERFLVMKEIENNLPTIESTEHPKDLVDKINSRLLEFHQYVKENICKNLETILESIKTCLENMEVENDKREKWKNKALEKIKEIEALGKIEIPKEIDSQITTPEEQINFLTNTIKDLSKELIDKINNKFQGIFGFFSLLDHEASSAIRDEFDKNVLTAVKKIRILESNYTVFSEDQKNPDIDCLPFIESISEESPIRKQLEQTSYMLRSILNEVGRTNSSSIPYLEESRQILANCLKTEDNLDLSIIAETKQIIKKIDETLAVKESEEISVLCLSFININFISSNRLQNLTPKEKKCIVDLITTYHKKADQVLYALTPEQQKALLNKLKKLDEYVDEIVNNSKITIPKNISNIIESMRLNPILEN